jgi:hypothetical protein
MPFSAGCLLYESDHRAVTKTGANQAASLVDGFAIMKVHIGRYRIEKMLGNGGLGQV